MKYHYTYRITNTKLNKHYYGVRSSSSHPKDDLGIQYFSSSFDKEFLEDQKQNPQNYKYKIILSFENRIKASQFEIRLHNRFDVGVNESFYNRTKSTSTGFCMSGIKKTDEHKQKIGHGNRGKKHSSESRKNMSEAHMGHRPSKETRKKMSESQSKRNDNNYWLNKKFSDEHKQKIGDAHRGSKRKRVSCPHCQKIGAVNGMIQWHFNNCKFKEV